MPLFRRNRDDEAVDPNARSSKLGLKYKDVAVLNQLVEAGADLGRPRDALYFSYFASRDVAGAAADEAEQRGFQVEVREPLPQYPDQWALVCEIHDVVLDPETVREHGDFFDSLAQRFAGDYDGWEASV